MCTLRNIVITGSLMFASMTCYADGGGQTGNRIPEDHPFKLPDINAARGGSGMGNRNADGGVGISREVLRQAYLVHGASGKSADATGRGVGGGGN